MKSKLYALFLLVLTACCIISLASCQQADNNASAEDGEEAINVTTVSFIVDDDVYGKRAWLTPGIPEKEPKKNGYTFAGWYADKGEWKQPVTAENVAEYVFTEDTEIYAKFDKEEYKIRYMLGGGTAPSATNPRTFTVESEAVNLSNPSREGYEFLGWYDGGFKVTSISKGTVGDRVLIAKWRSNSKYTVTFAANGGVGAMSDVSYACEEVVNLPYNKFSKSGYIFAGWKDSAGNHYYDAGEIIKTPADGQNITLTAQWKRNFGIDISNHQNKTTKINFDQMKANNIDFLILRASLTLIGTGTTKEVDESFEEYYKKAKALGIPIGVYHYSCANTAAEGRAEAEFLYNNCLKGKTFEFPIFMDVENAEHQLATGKNPVTTKQNVTDAINAFCGYLAEKGYFPAVYTYQSFIGNFNSEEITGKYDIWYAYYSSDNGTPQDTALSYKYGTFDMWQFSSKFQFSNGGGTKMGVDGNLVYKDYETFMKRFGLNGFNAQDKNAVYKDYATLAKEVKAGAWGATDEEKKQKLIAAGFDYNGVMDAVKYL